MRRVTQADTARALDLSVSTVGLVVSNTRSPLRQHLNKDTVRRIEEKAREMGYRPNRAAQIMRSGRTNLILHLNFGGYTELAGQRSYQIGRYVHEAGFEYQAVDAYWWPGEGERLLNQILAQHPEGVLVSGALQTEVDFAALRNAGIPVVGVGTDIPGSPQVRSNVREVFAELTRHCLRSGRIPMALFPVSPNWVQGERRLGFLDAVAADFPVREVDVLDTEMLRSRTREPWIVYNAFRGSQLDLFEPGVLMARRLLEADCLPDALVCANDHYAFGTMSVLQKAGVVLPTDVYLTGFDNLSFVTHGIVPLTSAEQPVEELCQAAVELLRERIAHRRGGGVPEETIRRTFPCRIHWRESTGLRDCAEPQPVTRTAS